MNNRPFWFVSIHTIWHTFPFVGNVQLYLLSNLSRDLFDVTVRQTEVRMVKFQTRGGKNSTSAKCYVWMWAKWLKSALTLQLCSQLWLQRKLMRCICFHSTKWPMTLFDFLSRTSLSVAFKMLLHTKNDVYNCILQNSGGEIENLMACKKIC